MNGLSDWFDQNPLIAWPLALIFVIIYEFFIIRYFFRKSIRGVITYLKDFISEEFRMKYFVAVVCLAAFGTIIFYGSPYLKELRWDLYGKPGIFVYFFILYLFPFATAYLLYPLLRIKAPFLRNPKFWALLVVSVSIFALRSSVSWINDGLLEKYADSGNQMYWTRIMSLALFRAPAIFGSVFIVWVLLDRKNMPFYGFTTKNFDLRPYFGMLCFMLPLVMLAALTSDFLHTYPRANGWGLEQYSIHRSDDLKYIGLFELSYGLDFINIELYFRGLLILAFLRFGGPKVILPAAVFYVFIHFGKPLGETISSFFGGTLLGIISYYSRSILGGIIIHMGIAWLMEVTAFISLLYL